MSGDDPVNYPLEHVCFVQSGVRVKWGLSQRDLTTGSHNVTLSDIAKTYMDACFVGLFALFLNFSFAIWIVT